MYNLNNNNGVFFFLNFLFNFYEKIIIDLSLYVIYMFVILCDFSCRKFFVWSYY